MNFKNLSSLNDFVPGDRTLFFDDFSETDEGEFPRKWTLRSPFEFSEKKVPVEVVRHNGKKYLRFRPSDVRVDVGTILFVRFNPGKDMPERFTVEFDAVFPVVPRIDQSPVYQVLLFNGGTRYRERTTNFGQRNAAGVGSDQATSANLFASYEMGDGQIHHVAISVNGSFIKTYVDGERVINDPDGLVRPVNFIGMEMVFQTGHGIQPLMFTNFRVAAGGKEIKSALNTDGKIVTHGIRFDTGSAEIRRESFPTLERIRGLIAEDRSLRFSIEGHTDNQGTSRLNGPLSERRAESVKAWLIEKGIEPERLATRGWGQAKPLEANDSAEGRANNRRVEFVRLP
ncbi:MAG: OmpA family protein [Deltaproteobacteria bacterium]|nr:OmpA family protein [Deltaproteobacteria bacterium]